MTNKTIYPYFQEIYSRQTYSGAGLQQGVATKRIAWHFDHMVM